MSKASLAAVVLLAVVALLGVGVPAALLGVDAPTVLPDEGDPSPDAEPDPDALFERGFVHGDGLESVSGERVTEVTDGTDTVRFVHHVAERPYVEYRSEVIEAEDPDTVGDAFVSNATTTWWYDADDHEVEYLTVEEPFDDAAVEAARAEEAERQRELVEVTYRGTETVADRETHVIDVTAVNETIAGVSLLVGDIELVHEVESSESRSDLEITEWTVRIDAEYGYPLAETVVVDGDDAEYVLEERFETVTFNDDLSEGTFVLDPPADAEVRSLSE